MNNGSMVINLVQCVMVFFFFQAEDGIRDVAVTGVQTCALPIALAAALRGDRDHGRSEAPQELVDLVRLHRDGRDRKSTRLNSSHGYISYAVFCLKKKKNTNTIRESPPKPTASTTHDITIKPLV